MSAVKDLVIQEMEYIPQATCSACGGVLWFNGNYITCLCDRELAKESQK